MPELADTSIILAALFRHHGKETFGSQRIKAWAFFPELRVGTGYGKDHEQRIDAWAINLYPSSGLNRISYEIKTSRADFLTEIKNPFKRRAAMRLSNEFYFVAPVGLITPEEVPEGAGLMEVRKMAAGWFTHVIVPAPFRESIMPTWKFVAALARRVAREEES